MRHTFLSIGDEYDGSCQIVMGSTQRELSLRRTMVRTKWFQGLCIQFPVDGALRIVASRRYTSGRTMHWTKLKPLSNEALDTARP
jgi:hypothetical protein